MRFVLVLLFAVITQQEVCRAALQINQYDPNLHDRFTNDASFIGSDYSWSGVGLTTAATWGTLISPSFIVSATHYRARDTIRFYESNDPGGSFIERTITDSVVMQQSELTKTSDLYLSMLDAPATGMTTYAILDLKVDSNYVGLETFVVGKSASSNPQANMRFGRNNIDEVLPGFSDPQLSGGNTQNDVFTFDYNRTSGLGADESKVAGGDSGAPSFVIAQGAPALVGVHWFRYSDDADGGSGDTFVPSFVDELNTAMASLGSSERVTTVTSVPEPSSVFVLLSMSTTLLRRQRRRCIQGC